MAYDIAMLVKVAQLYYEKNMTQQDIADELGLSRISITRMLHAAQKRGVVEIHIKEVSEFEKQPLSQRIEEEFGIKKAVLLHHNITSTEALSVALARTAGKYISNLIVDGQVVGLGWGNAVYGLVTQLGLTKRKGCIIVPVIGGINERDSYYNINEIVQSFSEKFECQHYKLYAPAVVESNEARQVICNEQSIKVVCDMWEKLDTLIVGIGSLKSKMPQTVKQHLNRNPLDFENRGICCDICYNCFDINGEYISTNMDDSFIRIRKNSIQQTTNVIALAWGEAKIRPIVSALRSGMIDVWISDESTALQVLEFIKEVKHNESLL